MIKLSELQALSKLIVSENITLLIENNVDYDLQTLIGSNHALFDIYRATVKILAKDTVPGSPTLDAYIVMESGVYYGIVEGRYIRINNRHTSDLDLYVSIEVPKKPL